VLPGFGSPRLDAQHTGSVRDVGHGLTRVDEQVEHDLLELDTIPEHPRQVLGQAKLQRDVGLRHVSAQNRRHPGDRRIDVDGLALAWLLADRGAYPLHDRPGPLGVSRDVDERLVQLTPGGRRGQHAARSMRVRGDRAQGLRDLVGERCRELSQGRPRCAWASSSRRARA